MLPAALPTCVFFALYAAAGVGFFIAALAIDELETGRVAAGRLDLGSVRRAAVNGAIWPALVIVLLLVFVFRGGR